MTPLEFLHAEAARLEEEVVSKMQTSDSILLTHQEISRILLMIKMLPKQWGSLGGSVWQPIDSAPKDGTQFIGYWDPEKHPDCHFNCPFSCVQWDDENEEWIDADDMAAYGTAPDYWVMCPEFIRPE